jgi:hypothetical protein
MQRKWDHAGCPRVRSLDSSLRGSCMRGAARAGREKRSPHASSVASVDRIELPSLNPTSLINWSLGLFTVASCLRKGAGALGVFGERISDLRCMAWWHLCCKSSDPAGWRHPERDDGHRGQLLHAPRSLPASSQPSSQYAPRRPVNAHILRRRTHMLDTQTHSLRNSLSLSQWARRERESWPLLKIELCNNICCNSSWYTW